MTEHKRPRFYSRLGVTILRYVACSLILAVAVGLALYLGVQLIMMSGTTTTGQLEQEAMADLQQFLKDQGVSSTDYSRLEAWNYDHTNLFIRIYAQEGPIYESFISQQDLARVSTAETLEQIAQRLTVYPLDFTDRQGQAVVLASFVEQYQSWLIACCLMVILVVFISVLLFLLRRKIRLITQMEEGVAIIGSGVLEYRLPVQGKDELAGLARGINAMTETMQQQMAWEQQVKRENYDLITSLSHDIRTPLTSVICYLDLLSDGQYDGPERRAEFIEHARSSAYHMKTLADDLFQHSLVTNEDIGFTYALVDGHELLGQLFSDCVYLLEDRGFTVHTQDDVARGFLVNVDIQQFHRVFDNLTSNALKYADPAEPICLAMTLEGQTLHITQSNAVRHAESQPEGSGIGLKTSQRIMVRHEGTLETDIRQERFTAVMTLPVTLN